MSTKLALAFLLTASASFATAQNNAPDSIRDSYHIFFPAMGKDILAARIGDHSYKIINVYNQPMEVYVDGKLLGEGELSKYNDVIQRIKATVKDDDEDREMRQMERDRRQAERDQEQAHRDQVQADRDRQRAEHDRKQAERDKEQSVKDREQQQRDREQQQRDREQQQRDREQQQRDREQASREQDFAYSETDPSNSGYNNWDDHDQAEQRQQSAEDRAMLKKGIQVLVDEHIITSSKNLKSLVLTDTEITVNGIRQPQNIYQQFRTTLGDWATHGLSYGANGPADNYSLSIVD